VKNAICLAILIIGTIFFVVGTAKLISDVNTVSEWEVGPHETHYWSSPNILALDGTYILS